MAKRIVRGLMVAAVALGILAAGTAPIKGPGASSTLSISR
jgi:hypothetical protein